MPLKDLERLTGELEELTVYLKAETEPFARRVIFARVQEIIRAVSLMNGGDSGRDSDHGIGKRPETV